MARNQWIGIVILAFVWLTACEQVYYEKEYTLESDALLQDQQLNFSFEIKDTTQYFNLFLKLSHTTEYPYQNLYFQLQTLSPDQDSSTNIFSVDLANKFGYWQGECMGKSCTLKVPLRKNIYFKQLGTYQLKIQQHTRFEKIREINALALMMEEVNQ